MYNNNALRSLIIILTLPVDLLYEACKHVIQVAYSKDTIMFESEIERYKLHIQSCTVCIVLLFCCVCISFTHLVFIGQVLLKRLETEIGAHTYNNYSYTLSHNYSSIYLMSKLVIYIRSMIVSKLPRPRIICWERIELPFLNALKPPLNI